MQYGIEGVPCSQGQKYDQTKGGHGMMAPMELNNNKKVASLY